MQNISKLCYVWEFPIITWNDSVCHSRIQTTDVETHPPMYIWNNVYDLPLCAILFLPHATFALLCGIVACWAVLWTWYATMLEVNFVACRPQMRRCTASAWRRRRWRRGSWRTAGKRSVSRVPASTDPRRKSSRSSLGKTAKSKVVVCDVCQGAVLVVWFYKLQFLSCGQLVVCVDARCGIVWKWRIQFVNGRFRADF